MHIGANGKEYKSPDEERWWADGCEFRERVNYPLTEESIFWDVGGHTGDWSSEIIRRYNPKAFIFEPVPIFYEACVERFKENPKVYVIDLGLSDHDGMEWISVDGVDSSLFQGKRDTRITLADVGKLEIPQIDLVSINCEGSEFIVLPRMIETGIVTNFKNIQVQFHDFYPDAHRLRDEIRGDLSKTHTESYCYPFVWESWQLKS